MQVLTVIRPKKILTLAYRYS
ncbi:MAG: hypothetical protein UY97_C0024G0006, partial [Parcubacteria group bacterium GW2011_GWB1_57_6]